MSVVTKALAGVYWHERKLLVACSGGIDSMVLLHGLLQIGLKPEILHVNYQLRGEESEADQRLVEETAALHGLKVHVHRCPVTVTKGKGVNLQAAARDFRRKLFEEWIARSPWHVVVVAHHADDQVETFFLQLLRGSGTYGLGGMHSERNQLIRPLLTVSRKDILDYARLNKVSWREDKSNAETAYLRNLLRNELLPGLASEHPDLKEHVLLLMRLFREKQQEIESGIRPMVDHWKLSGELRIEDWIHWDDTQRLAFTRKLDWPVWVVTRMNELAAGAIGNRFLVNDQAIWKRNSSYIKAVIPGKENQWDFKIEEVGFLPQTFDKHTIYLDAGKISGDLHMRNWQKGDRIQSLGMAGSQLVSDVLKDARIPLSDRGMVPVLTDEKSVLWIPGIRISRKALAGLASDRIFKITLR